MWRLGTSGIVCPLPTTPSGVSQLCASEDRAVLSQAKSMVNGLAHPGFKCEQTDCEQTVSKLTDQQFPNHPHFPLTLPVTHMLIHITSNLGIFVLVPTTGRKEHTIFHFSGKEWLPFIYPEAALLKFQWFSPGQAPWGVCGVVNQSLCTQISHSQFQKMWYQTISLPFSWSHLCSFLSHFFAFRFSLSFSGPFLFLKLKSEFHTFIHLPQSFFVWQYPNDLLLCF